jgi:hypothetical protein
MATMRSSASSKGPGMGERPSAASQRSGRGMRLSVAAIFTARRVLLRLLIYRGIYTRCEFYLSRPRLRPSSRARSESPRVTAHDSS